MKRKNVTSTVLFVEFFAITAFCLAVVNGFGALSKATGWRESNWGSDGWPESTTFTLSLVVAYLAVGMLLHIWLLKMRPLQVVLPVNGVALALTLVISIVGLVNWWVIVTAVLATLAVTFFHGLIENRGFR